MRVVSENTANAKAGEGQGFMISHIFESVSGGGKVYIHHVSGSKSLHSVVDINAVGQWRFTSYAGATYSDQGTPLDEINRKSNSPILLTADFYHTPIILDLGSPRLTFMFGAGTNPSTARSSSFGEDIESVFTPGTEVLIELENMGSQSQYCSVFFNVHEED